LFVSTEETFARRQIASAKATSRLQHRKRSPLCQIHRLLGLHRRLRHLPIAEWSNKRWSGRAKFAQRALVTGSWSSTAQISHPCTAFPHEPWLLLAVREYPQCCPDVGKAMEDWRLYIVLELLGTDRRAGGLGINERDAASVNFSSSVRASAKGSAPCCPAGCRRVGVVSPAEIAYAGSRGKLRTSSGHPNTIEGQARCCEERRKRCGRHPVGRNALAGGLGGRAHRRSVWLRLRLSMGGASQKCTSQEGVLRRRPQVP